MTAPGNSALQAAFVVTVAMLTAYAAGRIHQWYRQALERDLAWRAGYNQASHSLFHLAARTKPPQKPVRTTATAAVPAHGRHSVDGSTARLRPPAAVA